MHACMSPLPPPRHPALSPAARLCLPPPAGLPVWQAKADFISMVHASQTIILVGETGSGKTTQIGQFIAEVSWAALRRWGWSWVDC